MSAEREGRTIATGTTDESGRLQIQRDERALAEESEVVCAEPDLVHTVQEDAGVPIDVLFPQHALLAGAELGRGVSLPPTVLIVDDHAGFRRAARAILEADGYLVLAESATGGDALEAAARVRPALVLLDVGLPDIDGFELAGMLTAADCDRTVILISSRDAADYEPLLARCGARGFIPKDELCGSAIAALTT